ncbi:MAG: hypothetical protein ISS44_01925 [Candidatus Omnitrophica bacterium]|nr:hypothetical protein [Candidatus Omnitrophota bacterium]
MLRRLNCRGQNTAEYAILIGIIVAAAIAMQTYVKRGLQGRTKDATDYMATQTTELGTTTQYEPYYLESDFAATMRTPRQEQVLEGGGVVRTIDGEEVTERAVGGYQEYKDTSAAK